MDVTSIDAAVRGGDLDELVRLVGTCCAARDWDAVERLRAACERAHETGRQLWPVSAHAAYRLALEAPAPYAAAMLVEGAGRFTPGPLAEVAAQDHTWRDLAPHAPRGASSMIAAHERVVRGEDLSDAAPDGPSVIELPWRLAEWEPAYALAEYSADRAEFPSPETPSLKPMQLPSPPRARSTDDVIAALLEATAAWRTESNGRAGAAGVDGEAPDAIAALGARSVRAAEITPENALAHVAWAGASGGAHGRRRGAAAGRFAAWWLAGALAGALDDWPPHEAELGEAISSCRWYLWDATEPSTGWRLQLAIEHAPTRRAWAVAASDTA